MRTHITLPCYGRLEQTYQNLLRLQNAQGDDVDPFYYLVISQHDAERPEAGPLIAKQLTRRVFVTDTQLTYWESLELVRQNTQPCDLYLGIANDLLPGFRWLSRGVNAYKSSFGPHVSGLLGFNDGIQLAGLSPHFLIGGDLLNSWGGWPTMYRHTYGDIEMCRRAQAAGVYCKAVWALLYHDHMMTGKPADQGYLDAYKHDEEDSRMWERRKVILGI